MRWHVGDNRRDVYDDRGGLIAATFVEHVRMIAALPRLLEAAEVVDGQFRDGRTPTFRERKAALLELRRAIEDARGRS